MNKLRPVRLREVDGVWAVAASRKAEREPTVVRTCDLSSVSNLFCGRSDMIGRV